MNPLKKLFGYYETYHAHGRPLLKYIGIVAALSYVVFYLIRFTKPNPRPFDDLAMRLVVVVLFTLLALRDRWPEHLKKYYLAYSYVVLIYCLPFFNVFNSLERRGGVPSISNCFIALSFLVMVADWRNTLAILFTGTSLAALVHYAINPKPGWPPDLLLQIPAYLLVSIGGAAFKLSERQIDAEKSRLANALAGSIAHEMRNPLSQIRHNLEEMQQALPPPTTTTAQASLTASQVDTLYRRVAESDLAVKRGLQVIAMTLDEVSAKPVDSGAFSYLSAAEVTGKAIQEYAFESQVDARKVGVQVTEDFSFRGDETAYLFVVFNLVKNSLYCLAPLPDARVTITVGQHQVKVRDSGPGIPPEVLARLFEPFNSVGKSGGTGLGLAYCRRVMQAFGGEIECESVVGEYTQFTLRFPPVSDEENRTHQLAILEKARTAFAGKHLLIVDDDAAQRMTTRHKLQPLGAVVDQAADGQRALEALAMRHYDLVLLDLNMPVLDGYAVAERVRCGQAGNRDIAIVAYTSEPAHLAAVKTEKAGMDGFIAKPCAQLPMVQALQRAQEHAAAMAQPDARLAGRRILLADDSPYNRKAVAAYLKHVGASVVEADNGRAVLAHLQGSERWDAVLMDISMPGMDGLETAQAIRCSGMAWWNVPIIALTAHSDQRTMKAARSAGMNEFLVKPVEAVVLYRKLGQLVGGGAVASASVMALPPAATPGGNANATGPLLNQARLESYRRMGMLDELLNDYLPEIARLVAGLERSAAAGDLKECLDTLHSLLGMSGEAGAQGLYQLVRRVYVPMVEGHIWPAAPGWAGQITALAADSEQALRSYAAMQTPISAG